jgi:hypothetical protein
VTAVGQVFGDDPVVLDLAGFGAERVEVVIASGNRHDALARAKMLAI